ncbi:hypothetical protein HPP92_013705 [Vanilla planifolia]|uniref:F-box domain-containing protein n=1 Tax=Vanilla planifolia TaxID=51239 RepID=A0A835QVE0_VANPL|nr:hypothetical protein HPP92_013705 [Vanilla planifolia]
MNAEPNGSTCQWQHGLYPEILTLISDLLPLSDFISFRATCRAWRSAPSHRSNITLFSKFHVWTISYDLADDHLCPVYDMKSNSSCLLRLPSLRHSTCIISKHGWLLFVRDGDPSHFFFYNPFSLQEIPLPPYPNPPLELVEMIGSSPPGPPPQLLRLCRQLRGASTLEMAR